MKLSHLGTIQQEMSEFTKKKKRVNTIYPSQNIQKTPLERKSDNLSFKGVFSMYKIAKKKIDLKAVQEVITSTLGTSETLHLKSLLKDPWISSHIQLSNNPETGAKLVQFKEETPVKLILDGLKFPFTEMPANILEWGITNLQKIKIFKNSRLLNKILNSKFITKNRDKKNKKLSLHELQGLLETADKHRFDDSYLKNLGLFNRQAKMYSPKTGNYNSVHERSLNRIVSGYIPAFFLANDAYNLSSLCDNDPKAARKEKNIRFNQEIKRVTINAYIQLITLGALQKYIQKSKAWIVGTLGATVLFTEMFSRLSSGKNITFISSENAKKQNELHKKKAAEKMHKKKNSAPVKADVTKPEVSEQKPVSIVNSASVLNAAGFPMQHTETFKSFEQSISNAANNIKPAIAEKKELKPLLNFNTILAASALIITAGYSIRRAGKAKVKHPTKDLKLYEDYLKPIKAKCNSIYEKITEKEFIVPRKRFEMLLDKLKRNGFSQLADTYKNIADDYTKYNFINNLVEDVKLQDKAKSALARKLVNAGLEDDMRRIVKYDRFSAYKVRFESFAEAVGSEFSTELADELRTMFYKGSNFADGIDNKEEILKLYTEIGSFVKKNCPGYTRRFNNVFTLNDAYYFESGYRELAQKLVSTNIPALKELGKNMTDALSHAAASENIKLANKDKYLIKQGVDFLKEPFIFMWNTIKFPYYVTRLVGKLFEKPKLPKYDNGIAALSNCVNKLLPKVDVDDEIFKREFSKKLKSSFNSLSMSGVSNAELSNLTRFTSKVATIWFLIADNYNMVMLKSNGDDKPKAKQKAKERFVQELSRIFYATIFIDLFNSTFRKAYHASLLGMSAVTAACTVAGEYTARAAIGMPIKEHSQEEILEKERAHYEDSGIKGKFYRFMSRLTGKQVLTQRGNKS